MIFKGRTLKSWEVHPARGSAQRTENLILIKDPAAINRNRCPNQRQREPPNEKQPLRHTCLGLGTVQGAEKVAIVGNVH